MGDTSPAMGSGSTPALTHDVSSHASSQHTSPVIAASSTSTTQAIHAVNIKGLVPTLDVLANNYSIWRRLFYLVLGKFNLRHHVNGDEPHHDDGDWVRLDLTVLGWIYATITDELMQFVGVDDITAYGAWLKLEHMFRDNKMSRAIHLEADFRLLAQGDLSISAYCHKLKALADGLADCDQPISEEALVLQLIRGLSPKFGTLKTILPMQQPFPSFMQARGYLLLEETAKEQEAKAAAAAALLAAGVTTNSGIAGGGRGGDRVQNNTYNNSSGNGGGTGGGGNDRRNNKGGRGGRGRGGRGSGGGRNGGRDGQVQWVPVHPSWGAPWGSVPWRAPWTGATGPGILGTRPPQPGGQAYPMYMQPVTVPAPSSTSTWDTSGLSQALSASALQQTPGGGEWYLDTGATSHMTGEHGKLAKYCSSSLHNSSHIVVGNGSTIPILGSGSTTLHTPSAPFTLHHVLHTPHLVKNLISVRKFTNDNSCSIEFDPYGFSVKDLRSKTEILRSNSSGDLYPFPASPQVSPPAAAYTAFSTSADLWHQRLGHPGRHTLSNLFSHSNIFCNNLRGLSPICDACQLGRHVRLPFSTSTSITSFPFQIIHCDLWTSPIVSFSGYKYYLVILDDYTHYTWTFPLRQKSDTSSILQNFYSLILNQFHLSIQTVQCDNGGEFDNAVLRSFFAAKGISFRFSCPHTSQQNGKAERMIRTINDVLRTLLYHAHMPSTYWVEALHTATYLLNRRPTKPLHFLTPYQALFGQPPKYDHLRVFGCLCYPNLAATSPHKLAPRSTPCVFLGYPPEHKGYRCLDLSSRRITISRHVIFNELVFPFHISSATASSGPAPATPALDLLPIVVRAPAPGAHSGADPIRRSCANSGPASDNPSPTRRSPQPLTNAPTQLPASLVSPPAHPNTLCLVPPVHNQHSMQTRGKSGFHVPRKEFNLSSTAISPIPSSYRTALKDPNWYNAMLDEYNALMKNNTWSLVSRPAGINVVTGKWIFRHKFNPDGSLSRYKARWVVRGFSQQAGIDYNETFSPVIKPATIRVVLSIAASQSWPLHQLDVKNAFLHGNLSETVFCQQPSGFVDSRNPKHVCRLHKSLYGLKQAPRTWFLKFTTYLLSIGFMASKSDSSLFVLHHGSHSAYLLLYVDDIILTANTNALLRSIISSLSKEFAISDLGPLQHFLGVSVQTSPTGLFLSQEQYAYDLLDRANMLDCKACATPIDTKSKLSASSGTPVPDPSYYRSLAGALQYLTITRPDISYAVQQACLFMHDPREHHLHLVKRILRYVRGTLDYGLRLFRSSSMDLVAYSDADWAGCPDTRKSTSGYCVFLGNNLVSWSSKRQATVSRSSAEAEYRGVANAVAESCWLRQLLLELHRPPRQATVVFCDNVSAMYIASNPVQHQRTKHVEIDLHFVRDKVSLGEVKVLHVPSSHQFADIFTKGLPTTLFQEFRSSLHILPETVQAAGGCQRINSCTPDGSHLMHGSASSSPADSDHSLTSRPSLTVT